MSVIVVLLSTYNGEKYLNEQIESLLCQKKVDLSILVRDDGSTDSTQSMLECYARQGILKWYTGENLRSAKSFADLIMKAPDADYYAFCDQDDVWHDDKLYKAISQLEMEGSPEVSCLYCSNYQLVDAGLNYLPDNNHVSTTTFGAALVSSCCTGCTVVFNKTLLKNLQYGGFPQVMVMHDDWVHKVCLAIGGKVIYDNNKTLKYRQHGNNVDGGVHNIPQKVNQIVKRIKTKDRIRSKQIGELLKLYKDKMSQNNIDLAIILTSYYTHGIIGRIKVAFNPKIRTNYKRLNRGFKIAVVFNYF